MTEKTYRIGSYGVIIKNQKIILVKKSRGPFMGMYDLPGGKVEHGESHTATMLREASEELWIKQMSIEKIQNIYHYVSTHERQGITYNEHIIGVVMLCHTKENPDLDLVDKDIENNDAESYLLADPNDVLNLSLTPICRNALIEYLQQSWNN